MSRHLPALVCLLLAACHDPLPLAEDAPRTRRDAACVAPEDCFGPPRSLIERDLPAVFTVTDMATTGDEACLIGVLSAPLPSLEGSMPGDVLLHCESRAAITRERTWRCAPAARQPQLAFHADGDGIVALQACGPGGTAQIERLNAALEPVASATTTLPILRDIAVGTSIIALAGGAPAVTLIDEEKAHGAVVDFLAYPSLVRMGITSDSTQRATFVESVGLQRVAVNAADATLVFGTSFSSGRFDRLGVGFVAVLPTPFADAEIFPQLGEWLGFDGALWAEGSRPVAFGHRFQTLGPSGLAYPSVVSVASEGLAGDANARCAGRAHGVTSPW